MPFAPGGIEYRGDQYAFQGITGAARSIAGGIEDWRKKHDETQQKLETADLLKDYADKRGFTTPEFQAKYAAMSADQKAKASAGLAQTIVLQAHDAEQKAEMENRIAVANIHAAAARGGAGTRGPATVEELAYAQSYAPPGYNAVPTATGWQLVGKDPGLAKDMPLHKPGELIPDPTDPKKPAIGMWQKNDEIKYFSEVDPFKKKVAEAMDEYKAAEEATKAAGTSGGGVQLFHPSTWFGGGATPAPTPAVTPGPVIAPVATPTYPPVAPQGATVSPAPGGQDLRALAQQALNDPNATADIKAAARKILGQ